MDDQALTVILDALVSLGTGGVVAMIVYYLMSRHLTSLGELHKERVALLRELLEDEREERQRANLRTRSLLVRIAGIKSPDLDTALTGEE